MSRNLNNMHLVASIKCAKQGTCVLLYKALSLTWSMIKLEYPIIKLSQRCSIGHSSQPHNLGPGSCLKYHIFWARKQRCFNKNKVEIRFCR